METAFEIPIQSIGEVYKYLTKLQKRARKTGQEIFTFSFDDEVKAKRFDAKTVDGDNLMVSYNFRVLHIQQDVTIHEGWAAIAKLDVVAKEMKAYTTYNKEIESLGASLWTKHCDHCGHNKIVHTAFVMQKGNEFMKVGKGCMKELAPLSAARIAMEFDIYALWHSYLVAMTSMDGSGMGGGGNFGGGMTVDCVYDKTTLILAMRAGLEETKGAWVTSKYTEYDRGNRQEITNKGFRTFDHIQKFLDKGRIMMVPDQKFVDGVNADVELCLQKYSAQLGEKLEDVKTFAAADKARAIDIFLIKTVQGIIEREAKKDAMRVSSFIGEVGTKAPLVLEFVSEKTGDGNFGTWTLTIFKDASGNMFKKFGSVPDRFKEGNLYKFTAPIKAFETYDEIKYTVLGGPLSKFK
jgi:hypothetical protein